MGQSNTGKEYNNCRQQAKCDVVGRTLSIDCACAAMNDGDDTDLLKQQS